VAAIDGRIALANMGPVPFRARAAEQALAEGPERLRPRNSPRRAPSLGEDVHADRRYRQHLARVLTRRALEQRR
jgi:carbon-monoxide dehydrogenase medium subunit